MEIGTSVIAASMAELTGSLEAYRMKQIKENQPKPYELPKLTAEEREQAESFLKSDNLLSGTTDMNYN